ncbi:MAG: hypothetical protein ACREAB_01350 [Blastocatellia bacterium]
MKKVLLSLSAIIILVGAVAFQLLKFKLNESIALQTTRDIKVAQETFKATKGNGKYGTLNDLVDAKLIKASLYDGIHSGYRFNVKVEDDYFYVTAIPERYGATNYWGTGGLSIFVDSTGLEWVGYNKGREKIPDQSIRPR